MSPNKTLYIREDDEDAWQRADAAAHAARQSLSQYITGLIRRHAPEAPANGELTKITVEVGDGTDMWSEGFTGRWLAWDEGTGYRQGIALTQHGRFAWYDAVTAASRGELTVYASLDDLHDGVVEKAWPHGEDLTEQQEAGMAAFRAMIGTAAAVLGQEHVIWRDI